METIVMRHSLRPRLTAIEMRDVLQFGIQTEPFIMQQRGNGGGIKLSIGKMAKKKYSMKEDRKMYMDHG